MSEDHPAGCGALQARARTEATLGLVVTRSEPTTGEELELEDPANLTVANPDGWVRRGSCNGCGYCCQFLGRRTFEFTPQPIPGRTEIDVAFFRARGIALDDAHKRASIPVDLFVPCPEHNLTEKLCKIHETRPETCRVFPMRPEQVEATPCSYWFERRRADGTLEQRRGTGKIEGLGKPRTGG